MCVHICTCVRVHVCACASACVRAFAFVCVRASKDKDLSYHSDPGPDEAQFSRETHRHWRAPEKEDEDEVDDDDEDEVDKGDEDKVDEDKDEVDEDKHEVDKVDEDEGDEDKDEDVCARVSPSFSLPFELLFWSVTPVEDNDL